jgi:uncharacterized protein YjbJ (UPF0337 family)
MNNDLLDARSQQVGGQTRKWWGKLTYDDLKGIGGKAERLADALQENMATPDYTPSHRATAGCMTTRTPRRPNSKCIRHVTPKPSLTVVGSDGKALDRPCLAIFERMTL